MIVSQFLSFVAHWRRAWLYLATCILLFSFFLVACSDQNPGGNSNPGPSVSSPASPQVPLAQLHWCGKPVMLFRDEGAPAQAGTSTPSATSTTTGTGQAQGTPDTINRPATATGTGQAQGAVPTATATPAVAGTPKTITDWSQVEPNLGFTVYLPATLPQHSCLVSALGTIHDPIFGGSFTIGYLLPDHSSISLAEAPLRSQSTQLQCNVSTTAMTSGGALAINRGGTDAVLEMDTVKQVPTAKASVSPTPTQVPNQICSGAKSTTNIIFSARGTTESLQQFFNALQPNINWIPAA